MNMMVLTVALNIPVVQWLALRVVGWDGIEVSP